MSDFVLEAEVRDLSGKKAKQLRRDGLVPAVVYGQTEPVHILLDDQALRRVLRKSGSAELFELRIGGDDVRSVLIKDLQRHVTRNDLMHIDFFEVKADELVQQDVELVSVGTSGLGIALGFVNLMEQNVTIEALPRNLVTHIDVDISVIQNPDDMVFLRDLTAPEGVEILGDPDTLIAKFDYAQSETIDEEEEEDALDLGAAPDSVEVITAADDEEL